MERNKFQQLPKLVELKISSTTLPHEVTLTNKIIH